MILMIPRSAKATLLPTSQTILAMRSRQILLPLLLHVASITAVAAFASQSRVTGVLQQPHHFLSLGRQQQSLHNFGFLHERLRHAARLNVAMTDIQADLDMPELGNDGIYHIMDESQHK